ncbi:MAG: hypothetical protein QOI59_2978 [Gammaproteobacteria bacterium]|jgi:hypothetical protein|nr:hypothetical protein [Gammaproteobacteria bacterium]
MVELLCEPSDPRNLALDKRAGDDRIDRPIDYEQALSDPSTRFSQPEAVLKEFGLTREQKIEILRRWAYDESEIAGAEEEGMSALPALMMLICRTRDCARQYLAKRCCTSGGGAAETHCSTGAMMVLLAS